MSWFGLVSFFYWGPRDRSTNNSSDPENLGELHADSSFTPKTILGYSYQILRRFKNTPKDQVELLNHFTSSWLCAKKEINCRTLSRF